MFHLLSRLEKRKTWRFLGMGTLLLLRPGIAITIFAPALFTFASALFALFVFTATLFRLLLLLLMLLLMLTTRVTTAATKLMKLKAFEPPRIPANWTSHTYKRGDRRTFPAMF